MTKRTLAALLAMPLIALGALTNTNRAPEPPRTAIPAPESTLGAKTNLSETLEVKPSMRQVLQSTPETVTMPTFADGVRIGALIARRNPDVMRLDVLIQMTLDVWRAEQAQKAAK